MLTRTVRGDRDTAERALEELTAEARALPPRRPGRAAATGRTRVAHAHGTRGRYRHGCTCVDCRRAATEYAAMRARARSGLGPDTRAGRPEPAHGTRARYHWRQCRCDACRAAQADYQRAWLQRRRQQATTAAVATPPARKRPREDGQPRLPLEPLLRLLRVGSTSDVDVARRLGVHPRQLQRWRTTGVTVDQADELAVAVGRHPAEVWSEWDAIASG